MKPALILVIASFAFRSFATASPGPDLAFVLKQARAKMAQNLKVQPNYVCLETIQRSTRANAAKPSDLVDVLRFEVAFVGGRELYSWPGSGRFGQNQLWEMVPMKGSIGTGSFAVHAHNLFVVEGPTFSAGQMEGKLAKYAFDVPQPVSAYRIHDAGKNGAIVGYHGFVYADPATAQIVKMEILADQIPPSLKLKQIQTVLEYGTVEIGGRDYRLPLAASDLWTREKGLEQRNDSYFSSCRAYSAESKLTFDDPADAQAAAPTLPPGVEFQLELVTPIDSETSKPGKKIEATLVKPVGAFTAGASVQGQILRILKLGLTMEVEIRFQTVSEAGKQAKFTAAPTAGSPPITKNMANHAIFTRGPNREGIAEITILGDRLTLPQGNRSTWTTTKPQ